MKNKLPFFIVFLLISAKILAQDERVTIKGQLMVDTEDLSDIHIINKTSGRGTLSSKTGSFEIPVKVNDSLLVTGIQFYEKRLRISQNVIDNERIIIKLFTKINQLDSVAVSELRLKGNIKDDLSSVELDPNIHGGALDFSQYDFGASVEDIKHDMRELDATRLTDPNYSRVGIQLLQLFGIDLFKNTGRKEREKKAQNALRQKIRIDYGNDFFTKTLKIKESLIDDFLLHCQQKGLLTIYKEQNKLNFVDVLAKESKIYIEQF